MKVFCQLIIVSQSSIFEKKQAIINDAVEKKVIDEISKKFEILALLNYKDIDAIQLQVHIGNQTIFSKHRHYPKKRFVNVFGLEGALSKDLVFGLSLPERIELIVEFFVFCLNRMAISDGQHDLAIVTDGTHVEKFNKVFNAKSVQEFESLNRENYSQLKDVSIDVTFKISDDPLGSDTEYELRLEIEEKLGKFLESKNLGEVSGGSIGSGTMEVFCEIKSFAKGKRAILKFLSENNYPTPISISNIDDD